MDFLAETLQSGQELGGSLVGSLVESRQLRLHLLLRECIFQSPTVVHVEGTVEGSHESKIVQSGRCIGQVRKQIRDTLGCRRRRVHGRDVKGKSAASNGSTAVLRVVGNRKDVSEMGQHVDKGGLVQGLLGGEVLSLGMGACLDEPVLDFEVTGQIRLCFVVRVDKALEESLVSITDLLGVIKERERLEDGFAVSIQQATRLEVSLKVASLELASNWPLIGNKLAATLICKHLFLDIGVYTAYLNWS